ncbi:MAG: RHS repeat-associated core domain-containing protein [Thermodesulfobacteriota bacterium]|nr:RHS repeat-associated core domain-containing protein [Thermodesulfobacteriota bacterium]
MDSCVIEPDIGVVDPEGWVTVWPTETTTYTIAATGPGGTAADSVTITVTVPPPTTEISADPESILAGESSTLSWTSRNTTSCVIEPDLASVDPTGSITISPTETTTYTITATGSGGSATDSVTVTVLYPPTVTISADPEAILFEGSSTLSWSSTYTDACQIQPDIGPVDPSGSISVSPSGTTTYTITATGPGGTAMDSIAVTVTYPAPTVSISADPQTIMLGQSATLSWSSTYADSGTIDHGIGSVPVNGSTTVSPGETTTYTITATGLGGTATDTVTVTVLYPPTVTISAGPETILQGESSTLTWSSTHTDSCPIEPDIGTVDPSGSTTVSPSETTTYTITATGPGGSATDTVTVTVLYLPTVTISVDPESIIIGEPSTLTWTSTHADACEIQPDVGTVDPAGSTTVSPTETTTYTITATGPGGTATDTVTVTVSDTYPVPTVSLSADPASLGQGESTSLSWTSTYATSCFIDHGIGSVDLNDSMTLSPSATTTYTLTAVGLGGVASAQIVVMVMGNPEPQPEGSFGEPYEDLVPPDATVQSYDPGRFSLITGLVHAIDDSPISRVSVTIHDHPEYGTAFTGADGRFSIPVDGGGTITLAYQKAGLIPAQRKVYVPWNDIAIVETVQMLAEDPLSTSFSFDGAPDTVVAHRSTEVNDEFGTRACTMIFTGDNMAYLVDDEGNDIQQLTTITTRATEFTTPLSMPAILPPTSFYTYCAELTVEGAQRVRFDKPVMIWVDNFLGFDVGEIVPVGFFDRDRAAWVPSDNGVVVKLLDTNSDGIVDALDSNGDDLPDDLNNDGSFSDEVTGLGDAQTYPPNATFWRVALSHFSWCDFNWGAPPPKSKNAGTAASSTARPAAPGDSSDTAVAGGAGLGQCTGSGAGGFGGSGAGGGDGDGGPGPGFGGDAGMALASVAWPRGRVFHEDIPLPGTGITLHYSSHRVDGYTYRITVPASSDSVPDSLKRIMVKVEVAGRTFEQTLDPLPTQLAEFTWDGLDYLGRERRGLVKAQVNIGFVYDAFYYSSNDDTSQAFAQAGGDVTPILARQEVVVWDRSFVCLSKGKGTVAEGWNVSSHHFLDPLDIYTLHKGDGSTTGNNLNIIDTVAGNGSSNYSGDGGLATQAGIAEPYSVAIDAAGNFFIAGPSLHRVQKVNAITGIITTVAGNGTSGYAGDNGPATEAQISSPWDIALDSSGNLYIADTGNHCIRRVDTNGIITTVAGNGTSGYAGDNGPATQAQLETPYGIVVDSNDTLYVADTFNQRVRKVAPSGIISTVAGNGVCSHSGDDGPAIEAGLMYPHRVAVDAWGNLYISTPNTNRIRKVDTAGIITTVAGNGSKGYSGDRGPATTAQLRLPMDVAVDAHGNLYIADSYNHVVRKVDSAGIITTVAGDGTYGFSGDGGPATRAALQYPYAIDFDAAGNLYMAVRYNHRIRKVNVSLSAFANTVTSEDISFTEANGRGYIMSKTGQHKTTINLDTGQVLSTFGYDQDDNLVSITDRFASETVIDRDGNGIPTSITSPEGITTLTIDANNHLTRITYPDGSFYGFEYTSDGLMTAKIEPEGNRFDHQFDENGRLTDAWNEEGGHWQLSRTVHENGDIVAEVMSGEGNTISFLDHTYATGEYTSTITDPTGAQTLWVQSSDGLTLNKSRPCGMELEFRFDADSQYQYRFLKEKTETTPAGLEKALLREKTYEDTDSDDIPDLITETVTVNSKAITLENNVLQSQRSITSPEGRTATLSYDPVTLLPTTMSVPGLYDTTYGYDTKGRLTSMTAEARQATFSYNAEGFLETVTDPENHTTTYTYDPLGRVTGVSRPDSTSIGFTYDDNGNMTVLTNPSTVDHGFGYNKVNLNSSYQTPLSGSYTYVYDKDRLLTQTDFPSLAQIKRVYDTTRLIQIQTPEGNIDLTYLPCSKLESITNGTDTITYGYDGRLLTSQTLTGTLNQSLSYTYNNEFNASSFTYAGSTVRYSYDDDDLLTAAGPFAISRNAGNGLPEAVTGGALSLNRGFNGYGEIDSEDYAINSSSLTSWALTRDNAGRITEKSETLDGVTSDYVYTYDSMGRLLAVTKDSTLVEEYEYDANGARIYEMNSLRGIAGRTFDYSDEDHLLTAGDTTYQYDLDGFLTNKTNGTNVTSYLYSSWGELLSVSLPDGTAIEYVHDPLGRRIAKKVNGLITEKYLWQGLTRLLAVYDGSDNILMRFEYADARMSVAMTKAGSTYYLAYDQVGSLRAVADESGNVVKRIEYDSFGNILNDTNPSFDIPFGFAGGLHDCETGLVRFGFRDYDPDVGRWTAKDPIGFAAGDTDLYGYCLNDPMNWIDPLGLAAGRRIVMSGLSGAVRGAVTGAALGTPIAGIGAAPSALGGGIIGFSAGLAYGAALEALGWGEPLGNFVHGLFSPKPSGTCSQGGGWPAPGLEAL